MIIFKQISTGLDIYNPMEIFIDPEVGLMNILRHNLTGKCFRECYVLDVNKIINRSKCKIVQRGPDCHGTINILFEVRAIQYSKWENITGCKVVHKDKNDKIIICVSEHATICLQSNKSLESIRVGQFIIIKVAQVQYHPGSAKISVNAYPYMPKRTTEVFELKGELNEKEKASIEIILSRISEQEKDLKESLKNEDVKERLSFFKKVLYVSSPPKEGTKENLIELANKGVFNGFYGRHAKMALWEPDVYKYSQMPQADDMILRNYSLYDGLNSLLKDYLDNILLLKEMLQIYDTPEKVQEHRNLWAIIQSGKPQ